VTPSNLTFTPSGSVADANAQIERLLQRNGGLNWLSRASATERGARNERDADCA
jgi:hypothetical protein